MLIVNSLQSQENSHHSDTMRTLILLFPYTCGENVVWPEYIAPSVSKSYFGRGNRIWKPVGIAP